jgi:hypothetical protein
MSTSNTCRFTGCPNRATLRIGFDWPYIRVSTAACAGCLDDLRTRGWTADLEHRLELVT